MLSPLRYLMTRLSTISTMIPSTHQISIRHLRNWPVPPQYEGVEFPERRKLKFVDKVPTYPPSLRIPKMQRKLIFMRGPEKIHNQFIHEQYGIVAKGPGRLRYGHFEMLRLTIGRKLDTTRMFAVWRIDPPWQPVTRKGQGKTMGGGKPSIDHYVTPVKSGRVIIEVGGYCEFDEAKAVMREVTEKLPFPAVMMSHKTMLKEAEKERRLEASNINPYTVKYLIQNSIGEVHNWISPVDRMWYFKHV